MKKNSPTPITTEMNCFSTSPGMLAAITARLRVDRKNAMISISNARLCIPHSKIT